MGSPSAEQHREWRRLRQTRNPESVKAKDAQNFARFYSTVSGRASFMISNARTRSRKDKVAFCLSKDWVVKKLEKGVCEATGIPFVFQTGHGKGHRVNSFSPSLDRIDQTGPYSEDNVRVVCWIYNRARGAFPDDDFRHMVTALAERWAA